MGSKAKVLGLEEPVIMSSKRWEEVVDGLLRIIEVQGKGMDAMARALDSMANVGRVMVEGEEEGGGEEESGEGEGKEEEA